MSRVEELRALLVCEVCGQEAHPKFMQQWNGKDVCKYCIKNIEEETETHELFNYDYR